MRLEQAVAIAKRLVIHNDLDYLFIKTDSDQWQYVSLRNKKWRTNGEAYTPKQLIELALRK